MINELENMRARLNHYGGAPQQDRMIKDKRKTLDKVTLYSYQGARVQKINSNDIAPALITPNTVKQNYDDKIISIGFEYGYMPGTIFEWNNTNTKWIIYLQDLTELAYFRGDIRKCSYSIKWKLNNEEFSTYAAIIGPQETSIISKTIGSNVSMDLPNYSLRILMPASKEAIQYFKRYSKFYIQPLKEGETPVCWKVEATDSISMPGILEVIAVENYANNQMDNIEEGIVDAYVVEIPQPQDENIEGETFILPKKEYIYKYTGAAEASWNYDLRLPLKVKEISNKEISICWTTTYTGQFILSYGTEGKTIVVESLF